MKVRLISLREGKPNKKIRVRSGGFVIGRDESNDLSLQSGSISRRHCLLLSHDGQLWIADLASRNGTEVNGVPVRVGTMERLQHRDQIKLGRRSFRISLRDEKSGKPIVYDHDRYDAASILRSPGDERIEADSDVDRMVPGSIESLTPEQAALLDQFDGGESDFEPLKSSVESTNDQSADLAASEKIEFDIEIPTGNAPTTSRTPESKPSAKPPPPKMPKAKPNFGPNPSSAAQDALSKMFPGKKS